jgi:hypothetical protein
MDYPNRFARRELALLWTLAVLLPVGLVASGCGKTPSSSTGSPTPITVSLATPSIVVAQDGTPASVNITITSTSETALVSITGLPGGIQERYAASDTNPSGILTFVADSSAAAGTYTPVITVNSAGQMATARLSMTVAPVVKVSNMVDTTLGVKGKLNQFMSTSFQIAEWSGDYFGTDKAPRQVQLTNLGPQHIRLQALSQAIPMRANSGDASDWDFTLLDQIVQPVLAVADHSPEFQIAVAPVWMCDTSGHLDVSNHLADFATYAANLVRYYNKGGFTVGATHFQSASSQSITWWGVFNEFNINGLTAAQYVTLYNTVAPAMLAVDPSIKLSALELSDFGFGTGGLGDPMQFLPSFMAPANVGGVNSQVNLLSTHFYGTCNQSDPDTALFASVPQFANDVRYFYTELQTRSDLANTQVWVTENNVNADFPVASGMSTCNPGQTFVTDQRGTSAFFAAWRPYVFAQLGKAGNRALFHWDYSADKQYAEVDASGNPYLGYWVDRTLTNMYSPANASAGQDILVESSTDNSSIETLATRDGNGMVRVMVVDRAVHAAADNNGNGDPRTIVIDTSSMGNFTAASLLQIDSKTDVVKGPAGAGIGTGARITVTLNGYGVTFLSLMP